MRHCKRCARYDLMGFGQACPCTHVDGKCTTPVDDDDKPLPAPAALSLGRAPLPALTTSTRTLTMKGIYAIYDTKAQDLLGPPTLFAHAAPAVRWFGDVATLPDSQVGKHIHDFELVRLGYYDLDLDADKPFIAPDFEVILTGTAWAAAQQQPTEDQLRFRHPAPEER